MIFHSNGCGPQPKDCEFFPAQSGQVSRYWQNKTMYTRDMHIDISMFWRGISGTL